MKRAKYVTKDELTDIISATENGVIFLEGPSACGKTHLLKELHNVTGRNVRILSYEDIISRMTEQIEDSTHTLSTLANELQCDILCIEDVDFLCGRSITQQELALLAFRLSEHSLVIFTGIKLQMRVPHILMRFPDFYTSFYSLRK